MAIIDLTAFTSALDEALLQQAPALRDGVNEYTLIRSLQAEPFCLFEASALADSLTLFRTHFVLFNALYRLRETWLEKGVGVLDIHTTKICLHPYHEGVTGLEQPDPLRDYYLNWQNFDETGQHDVEALIDSFWRNIDSWQKPAEAEVSHARGVLEFTPDEAITVTSLKAQYRKLQHRYHPDKGGTVEHAQQLTAAYALLLKVC